MGFVLPSPEDQIRQRDPREDEVPSDVIRSLEEFDPDEWSWTPPPVRDDSGWSVMRALIGGAAWVIMGAMLLLNVLAWVLFGQMVWRAFS